MKKKLVTLLTLIVVLVLGVTACAGNEVKSYTVTFAGEGVGIAAQTVKEGGTVIEPNDPVREGYTFDGWFVGDEKFDFSTKVTSDITLTAKWSEAVNIDPNHFGGEGTLENPYVLAHPNHLMMFSDLVNNGDDGYNSAHYELGADIDMSGEDYIPAGKIIEATEEKEAIYGFTGSFDGKGHKISNLTVVTTCMGAGYYYVGLFGLTHKAVISDFTLENIDYTVNVYTSSSVSVYVGGAVGRADLSNVQAVAANGEIKTSLSDVTNAYIGGIAGIKYNSGAYIVYTENCYADVTVSSVQGSLDSANVGGLVGYISNSLATEAVINCAADGEIKGGERIGGIAGVVSDNVSILNCRSGVSISASAGDGCYVGGIVGQAGGSAFVSDCLVTGKVKAKNSTGTYKSYAGGIVGYGDEDEYYIVYNEGVMVTNCHYTSNPTNFDKRNNAGEKISASEVTDDFVKNVLGYSDECWTVSGAESKPTNKLASEVKSSYTVTLKNYGQTSGTITADCSAKSGYTLFGTPAGATPNDGDVFWAWEVSDGVALRYYTPIVKDMTLTAKQVDVTGIATDYKCTYFQYTGNGATAEKQGSITLYTDGTLSWYKDSASGGTYRYDGNHIILEFNDMGEVAGTIAGDTMEFTVNYGTSGDYAYTFEAYTPDILGEYVSDNGDILTFRGTGLFTFETTALAGGDYISASYIKSGNEIVVADSGTKSLSSYFESVTMTIDGDGKINAQFTAKSPYNYSVNTTFEKLEQVDYSDEAFVGTYTYAYLNSPSGNVTSMDRYKIEFKPNGDMVYSSEFSDKYGRYYYFNGNIKMIFEGYASSFVYDEEQDVIYGRMSRGEYLYRTIVLTREAKGKQYGYCIDGSIKTVLYRLGDGTTYYFENDVYVKDAVIGGDFTENSDVSVKGKKYRVLFYPSREGYGLASVGAEEGTYKYGNDTLQLDGLGAVCGNHKGLYKVYDGLVVAYVREYNDYVAFYYETAKANDNTITKVDPDDDYQGVWYCDGTGSNGVYYEKYNILLIDGFGHATLLYYKHPDTDDYEYNWSDWGTYTLSAAGINVAFNEYNKGEAVFYYNGQLVWINKTGGGISVRDYYIADGYDGPTVKPQLDASISGAYSGTVDENTVTVNLRADGTGTYNGNPFVGVYDGEDAVRFTLGGVNYKILIGDGNALSLVVGNSAPVALSKTGAITEQIPAALCGTWSGTWQGYGTDNSPRPIVVDATGTHCTYNGTAIAFVSYDAKTNTAMFNTADGTIKLVWNEDGTALTATYNYSYDEADYTIIGTLTKQQED